MKLSIVIPIYNERENIGILYRQLNQVLQLLGRPYEILFVDDGSQDGSREELKNVAAHDANVKLVLFRRNYGQTAAMQAGLQHHPRDAPRQPRRVLGITVG